MDWGPGHAGEIGSIAALVRAQARQRPGHVALTEADRRLSFVDLDQRSNRVAAALVASGVAGAGDRVAYLGRNTLEFFELLFGASKVGAVTVPVNWRLAPPEVAQILDDSTAAVLVVGPEHARMIGSVRGGLRSIRLVVTLGPPDDQVDGSVPYERWVDRPDGDDPGHEPAPDDVALQLYTSGTTGQPKGAMLTNRNVWNMLPVTARDWGFGADSVNLVTLPNFHVGGVGWALVGLFAGASSIVLPEFAADAVLDAISRHGVTHVVLVPSVLPLLWSSDRFTDADVGSLQKIVYGASPISESVLAQAIDVFDCRFIQGYGLTETVGAVIHLLEDDHDPGGPHRHRLRAAGRPMEGVEVRIVDPATERDVVTGTVGEIWLRTPRVMAGYWHQPEATRQAITPTGWLRTGDAGHVDSDGYVYLSDRVKDMIISGGENVYPAEVENVLMAHPAVADVAVIGVPSERWGETPRALVVPVPGEPPDEHELIAFCRARMAHYKCPTSVELVDQLPRNATGKVLKSELRTRFWDQRSRQVN